MGLHWVKCCKCGVMRFKCLKAYHAVFMSEFGLTFMYSLVFAHALAVTLDLLCIIVYAVFMSEFGLTFSCIV